LCYGYLLFLREKNGVKENRAGDEMEEGLLSMCEAPWFNPQHHHQKKKKRKKERKKGNYLPFLL
jgi:hypothetical protein